MGFQTHQEKSHPSSESYQWGSQPKQFSGQCLDRVGPIDEHMIHHKDVMESVAQPHVLKRLKTTLKLPLRWPHVSIRRSLPNHQP